MASLHTQAQRYSPHWLLGQSAELLERRADGGLRLVTIGGEIVHTRSIVIAGGIGTFTPRPLPIGSDYVGRGVDYFVTDPNTYAGEHVVVVGGGDSAVDWALMIEPIAASVTLVHRWPQFRAHAPSLAALDATNTAVRTPYVLHALHGSDFPEQATIKHTGSGEVVHVPCPQSVAALGFTANLGAGLDGWGLQIVERHIVVDSTMCTGVRGIYAAGDITEYSGKVRLISVIGPISCWPVSPDITKSLCSLDFLPLRVAA